MSRSREISFTSFSHSLSVLGKIVWSVRPDVSAIKLPQLYWADGTPWQAVNLWAYHRFKNDLVDAETVKSNMKHLARYANFLEENGIDWRHFPIVQSDRVLYKFREYLITKRNLRELKNSTASACMSAVIMFYRFAAINRLVAPECPMWNERTVAFPIHDAMGFQRTLMRATTDLRIKNNKRHGLALEDGLMPISFIHMGELLEFTGKNETGELHLMLCTGFFTGCRAGTVVNLTVSCLDTAVEHPMCPGIYMIPVGPAAGISTKFSVDGNILIPEELLRDLQRHAGADTRLLRQRKAAASHKNLLFLNKNGKPYTPESLGNLVRLMREKAFSSGLRFAKNFHFHQARATYGTWLAETLLSCGATVATAIGVVRDALLHKNETVTMRYIKFLEHSQAKAEAAKLFNEVFTGIKDRDWSKYSA